MKKSKIEINVLCYLLSSIKILKIFFHYIVESVSFIFLSSNISLLFYFTRFEQVHGLQDFPIENYFHASQGTSLNN